MKKMIILVMMLILASGCSQQTTTSYSSKLSYGNDTLATQDDMTISYQELYETLLEGYGANKILNEALMKIADIEITDQNAIDEEVNRLLELYTTATQGNLENYVKTTLGYDSIEAYKEDALIPNAKQGLLLKKYIEAHYDDLVSEYHFVHLKQITVENESSALEVIHRINEGENYDDIAKEILGESGTFDLGLVNSKTTTLDSSISGMMSNFTQTGLYPDAVALSNGQYAVLYIDVTQEDEKDDIVSALANISDVTSAMESYYLETYAFDCFEPALIEQIKQMGDFLK